MADLRIVRTVRDRGHGSAGEQGEPSPGIQSETFVQRACRGFGRGLAVSDEGLVALFGLAGQLLGDSQGRHCSGFGSLFNFVLYFFSDRLVLKMYRAQLVTEAQAPEWYRMGDRLRQRAGPPMPVVAVA